jgi:hypothetical protein
MADKKISELPLTSAINTEDISLLVSDGTDYKFAFTSLLQFIGDNLNIGAKVSVGTVLPSNSTGKNGDLFIKTDTGAFAQKVSGVWTVVYTIPSSTGITNGTILYGIGVPGSAIGNDNDTYINTGIGVFYKKASGTWSQVFSMQTGPQGPQGVAGTNGTNGTNGFNVLNGATTPSNSSTGVNGDFYINTSTYTLYGPKTGGIWGNGISLIGNGIPSGGTTGQVLVKNSNDDLDADWGNLGVSYGNITGDVADSASLSAALNEKADLVSGKVPSGQLPSYVDDILEVADFASLPGTGEAGKIYVTLDDNCEYRWSGSTYIQLVASPGSTDAVPEGSTNKYFTVSRVLSTVLSGISFLTNTAVSATDTILAALGKLQAQLNGLFKIPDGGTSGQVLAKVDNTGGNVHWIDTPISGGSPGGADKQLQFNDAGTFGGSSKITFDGSVLNINNSSLYLGSSTQNPSALLQLDSTSKGFLIPRMTHAQRLGINSPYIGLQVYQTDIGTSGEGLYQYKSTGWINLTNVAGNDKEIQFNDNGNIGAASGFYYNKATGQMSVGTPPNGWDSTFNLNVTGNLRVGNKLYFNSSANTVFTGFENSYPYLKLKDLLLMVGDSLVVNGNGITQASAVNPVYIYAGNGGFQWNVVSVGNSGTSVSSAEDIEFRNGYSPNQRTGLFKRSGSLIIQTGGTFTEISSAITQINSTTRGVLLPRMTTDQKNAVGSPVEGLIVYDATIHKLCYHNGTLWKTFETDVILSTGDQIELSGNKVTSGTWTFNNKIINSVNLASVSLSGF